MKKLIPVIVIVLIVAGVGAWLMLNLNAKQKYDKVRDELEQHTYSVVPMDADIETLLTEARASWIERFNEVGAAHSVALKKMGLRPSVSDLVSFLTYRLPKYSFSSPNQNKKSIIIAMMQGQLFTVTIDQSIHLSDDGHLILIRCSPDLIFVFSDDTDGLREITYYSGKETSNNRINADQ